VGGAGGDPAPAGLSPGRRLSVDRATLDAVRAAPAREHGSVFRRTGTHPMGGLRGAGSVPGGELWLVASANGLGLFDAASGQRLARHRGALPPGYPERTPGLGAASGVEVAIAGLDGGALAASARDGWRLAFDRRAGLWLTAPDGSIEALRVPLEDVRVLGFSGTGRSLVVGDAATLLTFAR
jgi:hypothetical protein